MPFFEKTFQIIDNIYKFQSDNVKEFNINLVKIICSEIGIKTKFKISSKDYNYRCSPPEKHIIKILKKN